jgi:hypothetical protein
VAEDVTGSAPRGSNGDPNHPWYVCYSVEPRGAIILVWRRKADVDQRRLGVTSRLSQQLRAPHHETRNLLLHWT